MKTKPIDSANNEILLADLNHRPPMDARMPLLRKQKMASEKAVSPQADTSWRKLALSIVVVVSVAFAWALSTQFSKTALNINPNHFNAPYCMMWFNTNFMLLCYPAYLLFETVRGNPLRAAHESAQTVFGKRGLTPLSLVITVAPFLLFWIGANYTYSRALMYVSASIATSISSCNAAIVYFLAILLLGDKFRVMKLLSVVFAVAGVVVISLGLKSSSGPDQWLGIGLAVLSAASAAVYKVSFKRLIGNPDLGQVSMFMTSLGSLNLLVNCIPAIILASTGVELVEWAWIPWGPMVGAALLSLTFNFLINFGIALLHPLVISVGMLLGIPLNTAIDILFRHVTATGYFLGGTGLICVSFFLIIFPYDMFCAPAATSPTTTTTTTSDDNDVIGPDYANDRDEEAAVQRL